MMTIPNCISFLRIPLAFVFLQQNSFYRAAAIILAMATDGLDGFLARKTQSCSRVGTTLDPVTDKFFVFFVLAILMQEHQLTVLEAICMLCRDFSGIIFGFYLIITGRWGTYRFRASRCGKITTFLQFMVLIALTYKIVVPEYVYSIFILLGLMALFELYYASLKQKNSIIS